MGVVYLLDVATGGQSFGCGLGSGFRLVFAFGLVFNATYYLLPTTYSLYLLLLLSFYVYDPT